MGTSMDTLQTYPAPFTPVITVNDLSSETKVSFGTKSVGPSPSNPFAASFMTMGYQPFRIIMPPAESSLSPLSVVSRLRLDTSGRHQGLELKEVTSAKLWHISNNAMASHSMAKAS